ncbi:SDR family NAD(P)-dependent oxidoreductase [Variovorax ginsengisoli]|uniref:NAD(P)-dependent dehydrogenase (Short-subunit alcohol dehydrogenase family) n=1 Tax=Variovorax ginsengisoli TaxID=363844 RepID=A0ABT9S788_9BURK|nr:SDR family NAD(P)-dependent oxidoreductase [Variovorax ginsengisoli]MDP9899733.1 NAD(P)-dependent dehydrogenase (short-subunit alcohol dehydrogenase family) [Variovorax ginsengisoli]
MGIQSQVPDFDRGVAVVTGAAAGIGRATAMAFASCGARVALIDIDADGLAATSADIRAQGGMALALCHSVADEQAMQAAADEVTRTFGRCDVLVNNAGVLLRGSFTGPDAPAQWRRTLDVNLSGAFYASRAFLPLLQAGPGCIVNVASIHACVAVENSAAYTASKGGLKQLTQALALELAPMGIRVNAVAPGSIETAMTAVTRADGAASSRFLERVPLRRAGQPSDVVNAIQFLASDLASYITGATLPVDGGYLAN